MFQILVRIPTVTTIQEAFTELAKLNGYARRRNVLIKSSPTEAKVQADAQRKAWYAMFFSTLLTIQDLVPQDAPRIVPETKALSVYQRDFSEYVCRVDKRKGVMVYQARITATLGLHVKHWRPRDGWHQGSVRQPSFHGVWPVSVARIGDKFRLTLTSRISWTLLSRSNYRCALCRRTRNTF